MFGAGIVALAIGVGSLFAGRTHAAFTICRTDPTVYLSDGHTIQMYADISDALSDVKNVTYTLHVPYGVKANGISYDSTGYLETVNIVADQPSGRGYSDTVVTTGKAGTPVTAYSGIQGVISGTVSGYSGQHLDLYYYGGW